MIEKLPFTEIHTGGEDMVLRVESRPVATYEMQHKINELVDTVNGMLYWHENLPRFWQNLSQKENTENKAPAENVQDETPRCPFCGEELSYAQEIDGGFDILTCDCPAGLWLFGNDKMWYNLKKATTELERTRKALDVAVDALNAVTATPLNSRVIHDVANKAIEQITALEQKDVK